MLAKILEEMRVEPEVLEALSEEQKRILFFKMREEQVRRWREREETEENDDDEAGPKKASRKHVTWLLGRDGDVRVSVIGEEDELRSSKLLQSLLNNRYHDACVADVRQAASSPQRGVAERGRNPLVHSKSVEETPGCGSAGGEPADAPSDRDSESGRSRDNLRHRWAPLREPQSRHHGNRPPLRTAQSLDAGRTLPLDRGALTEQEEDLAFEARVAQFKKICAPGMAVNSKPPIPTKPPHLQRANCSVPRQVPEGITAS